MPATIWTAEDKKRLGELVDAGVPYARIREIMNEDREPDQQLTKNAIIGAAHRHKTKGQPPKPRRSREEAKAARAERLAKAKAAKPPKPPKPPKAPKVTVAVSPPPPPPPPVPVPLPPPRPMPKPEMVMQQVSGRPLTLYGVWPRSMCRFPIFDNISTAKGRLFCGEPVEGLSSYCEKCQRRVYRQPLEVKRDGKVA